MKLLIDCRIEYYETNAVEYCRSTATLDMSSIYERFLRELVPGSHILDAGCGSGRDSKAFLMRGFAVTAFDASPQMADFATVHTGRKCRVLRFDQMRFRRTFDGIWACASLVHVPKREIRDTFARFIRALKPGGIMYASFIEGEGERVSDDGRTYTFYAEDFLEQMLRELDAVGEKIFWKSDEHACGKRRAPWLNLLFRRAVSGRPEVPIHAQGLNHARRNGRRADFE